MTNATVDKRHSATMATRDMSTIQTHLFEMYFELLKARTQEANDEVFELHFNLANNWTREQALGLIKEVEDAEANKAEAKKAKTTAGGSKRKTDDINPEGKSKPYNLTFSLMRRKRSNCLRTHGGTHR